MMIRASSLLGGRRAAAHGADAVAGAAHMRYTYRRALGCVGNAASLGGRASWDGSACAWSSSAAGGRSLPPITSHISGRAVSPAAETLRGPCASGSKWSGTASLAFTRAVRGATIVHDPHVRAFSSTLLTAEQNQLVQREKQLLGDIHKTLAVVRADDTDLHLVMNTIGHLDEMFLLCVVGEFNSGKSSLINALVGQKVLLEGVTPTTANICVLHHADVKTGSLLVSDFDQVPLSAPLLQGLHIVDTPGTNAIVKGHQALTESILPRADLVLFVTSADRPFSESEKQFLSTIYQWRKKVVLVVNKIDILRNDEERAQVMDFVQKNGKELLGPNLDTYAISAYKAQQFKMQPSPPAGASTDRDVQAVLQLESYIRSSLTSTEKIRLKLNTPLGVAASLLAKYQSRLEEAQTLLKDDIESLQLVEESLKRFQQEMHEHIELQKSTIGNLLTKMIQRAHAFTDDKVTATNVLYLMRSEQFQRDFQTEVLADLNTALDDMVASTVNGLLSRVDYQARSVVETLVQRANKQAAGMVGKISVPFQADRSKLLDAVKEGTRSALRNFDSTKEANRILSDIHSSLLQTTGAFAGVIGVTGLMAASAFDWTGLAVSGVLAATGLYIIPAKRSQLKKMIKQHIEAVQVHVETAVVRHLDNELQAAMQAIELSISPYSAFVRRETNNSVQHRQDIAALQEQVRAMTQTVQQLK